MAAVCANASLKDAFPGMLESKFGDWRDESWAVDSFGEDKAESTNTSSSDEAAGSASAPNIPGFVTHKVRNTDTLAGLAIKYSVPISHIKRANGIISDSAMYGRQHLIIPVGGLHMREGMSAIFAQLAGRLGRDPLPDGSVARNPSAVAATRIARALQCMDHYDGAAAAGCDLWDDGGNVYSSGGALGDLIGSESRAGGKQVSRGLSSELNNRRKGGEQRAYLGRSASSHVPWAGERHSGMSASGFNRLSHAQSADNVNGLLSGISDSVEQGKGFFANLSKSIRESSIVRKIKHAASHPVLGVTAQRTQSMVDPCTSGSGMRATSMATATSIPVSYGASYGAAASPLRSRRDGGKDE